MLQWNPSPCMDSVRITWDPPADPNDDTELLHYNVYYEVRTFGQPQTFQIAGRAVDAVRAWNDRSVLVAGASQQSFIVAYVVAISTNGMGAVVAEQSYGITFGNCELCKRYQPIQRIYHAECMLHYE